MKRKAGRNAIVLALLATGIPARAVSGADTHAAVAAALAARGAADVVVTFTGKEAMSRTLSWVGGRSGIVLQALPVAAFEATADEVARLAQDPGVQRIDLDNSVPGNLETATAAIRARAVWGSDEGGPLIVDGQVIDGSGVGVAVVDTGVLASHPDLRERVVFNAKIVSTSIPAAGIEGEEHVIETPDSDTTGGHGTHVAGIVAGTGALSGGRVRGAAPGASLYAFGVGEGRSMRTSSILAAFDWILRNHDRVAPPIRVVNNSWGDVGAHDPGSATSVAVRALVDVGIVVVFSAGNGNEGEPAQDPCPADTVNGQAKNPTPGVISVAATDDENRGTRGGSVAWFSSRGASDDPSSWPDVAAPGHLVLAAADPATLMYAETKPGDPFTALFPGANPFGTAVNQHEGELRFRLGGRTSGAVRLAFTAGARLGAVYNAHRDAFIVASPRVFDVNASEASQMRFYSEDVPANDVILPPSASAQRVASGDALLLTHDHGTGNPISLHVTSPAGDARTVSVEFPCTGPSCSAEVELSPLFGDQPADGTWTVAPGGTLQAGRAQKDEMNPLYVQVSGTSMAAPLVAATAALVLQADPELTPAAVERLLEDTAFRFGAGAPYQMDPQNPGSPGSCDKGHGLIDARAAVEQVLADG